MDKKKLNQYRALQREIPRLKKEIKKLNDRLEKIPTVAGKVIKSSDEFPYIVQHVGVEMHEPKAATEIKKQIRLRELQLDRAERTKTEILRFVSEIEDSTDRQIFELYFLEGYKQDKVATVVGYSRGRISQIIGSYLKD